MPLALRRLLPPTVCLLLFSGLADAQSDEDDPRTQDPAVQTMSAILARMEQASARLKDLTFTFYKQEYVRGNLRPEEKIAVKQRRPTAAYLRWVGDVNTGREVLWQKGWNDGNIRVNPGPMLPTLNLDPLGRMAMATDRHSIYDLGPAHIVELISRDANRLRANKALPLKVTDLGPATVRGEPARCLENVLPKDQDPAFYASRVRVCVSERVNLPVSIEIWDVEDGAMRVVERYAFEDIRINPGLSDLEFSPDNPNYNF